MSRNLVTVSGRAFGAALIVLGVAGTAAPVVAQQEVRIMASSGGPMGGRGSGQIPRTSLDRYGEILGLDDSQKELAAALFEGYSTAYQEASKARGEAMRAVRDSFQESQDPSVFQEKMPEITRAFTERSTALEKQFYSDLRAVLTPDQEQSFAKVERHRRRETGMRGGPGAGGASSVDLTEVARALKLTGPEVAESLEQYEAQLDRVLIDRQQTMAQLAPAGGGMDMRFDPAQMQEMMVKSREFAASLRELNESYARRLEGLVPEGQRAEFTQEMKRRSYPQVYREAHVSQSLGAAERFGDLTSEQRQSLADLRAAYNRDLPGLNERWANAIAEAENDEGQGQFTTPDGGVMQMRFGEEPEALREARKARRDLDDRTREKMNSILTKAQQERLPKREEQTAESGAFGAFVGQSITIEDRR